MYSHRNHLHYIHLIFKNKELRDMYVAISLKTFAIGMVGIFVPIYLMIEKGMSLSDIVLFHAISFVTFILVSPFIGKFASRYGLKKSSMISAPLFAIAYFGLYNSSNYGISLNYVAILLGLVECVYWQPFIMHFIRSSDKKHRSEEVGFLSAITIFSGMLAPFAGGVLISLFGFDFLFMLAGILLLVSIFPIWFTKDVHEPFKCDWRDLIKMPKKNILQLVALGGTNIVELVFWPLFFFSVLEGYTVLGMIFFIAEFAAFLSSFFIGAIENREKLQRILKWGAVLCAITWFSRVLFYGVFIFSLLTVLTALLSEMIHVPLSTLQFDEVTRKKYLSEYVIFRGVMINLGRLLVLGVISIFLTFNSSFITSGLMFLVYLF